MSQTPGKTLAEVLGEVSRLNKQSAEIFPHISGQLQQHMSAETLLTWANTCFEISDSGWHAWEASNLFMLLSPAYLKHYPAEELLAVGRYGLKLCSTSFEPGIQYFKGIQACLDNGQLDRLGVIETTGKIITERFEQASNLISDYFATAFLIAESNDSDNLRHWTKIAAQTVGIGRAEILALLKSSRLYPEVNWLFARQLYQISERYGDEYVAAFGQSARSMIGVEKDFEKVLLEFASKNLNIEKWLQALTRKLPVLTAPEIKHLMQLTAQTRHPDQAEMLAEFCHKLPLDQLAIMQSWLAVGIEMAALNFKASLSFIRLESARSIDLLEELRGQVRFSEEQRRMQLYSEALIGRRLRIETNLLQDEAYRSLPSSDGDCVFLPEVIGFYACREDNDRWLKVALTHQLGCYEFGTFDYSRNNSYIPFSDFFHSFEQPNLAADLFSILESGRIDWLIQRQYRGIAIDFSVLKNDALKDRNTSGLTIRKQLLEAAVQISLDAVGIEFVDQQLADELEQLVSIIQVLKLHDKTVYDTVDAVTECYAIVSCYNDSFEENLQSIEKVSYRGFLSFDKARMNLALLAHEEAELEMAEDEEPGMSLTGMADSKDVNIDELKKGDVQDATAIVITDQDLVIDGEDIEEVQQPGGYEEYAKLAEERKKPVAETAYKYDEWDYQIDDYRKRWCTLYEIRETDEDPDFVPDTLSEHRGLANQVRKQLNMLRPELLRKVKGMVDGEELDLERAVEAVIDRRAGISPNENIYIQRQRKDRDVSALFLLDMSASTDDAIVDPDAEAIAQPNFEEHEFMHDASAYTEIPKDTRTKIIDLEKQSVVLMAEALQGLGDSYSICGFSGYGRDRVEYYLVKDFDEPYNHRVKGRIGGIKPCRSTRMGPAIRHATKMLAATESRVKALIIISDGYPQDFDYGSDRNSKDYGIKDTTKALTEATQKGVQSFCLTVDPSGHDYLREMCPDQQYMVMQDIAQLPNELSKIYRGLTT